MFTVNDDLSIYVTRGDIVFLSVTAEDNGEAYKFQPGDVVRIKVFTKKDCETVVLQKDFPVTAETEAVEVFLDENDTKIGGVIDKPTDYWYEVELNPFSDPQTIIGYDEDGAKVFKLFPEGRDLTEDEPITPEDIPIVDKELDLTSQRPVENQAIARAVEQIKGAIVKNEKDTAAKLAVVSDNINALGAEIDVERARISNLLSGETVDGELIDIRTGADGNIYASAGDAVRRQTSAKMDKFVLSVNRLDGMAQTEGYALDVNSGAPYAFSGFYVSDFCDIATQNESGTIRVGGLIGGTPRICFYDINKGYISVISGADVQTNALTIPPKAVYARVQSQASLSTAFINVGDTVGYTPYEMIVFKTMPTKLSQFENDCGVIMKEWHKKNVLFWGDSITAQGNNDSSNFYGAYAAAKFGFASVVRGVGGQTYKANTATFYANTDGSYAGRYGQNGLTEAPEGTTEHLGYLCSWDRITAMIPADIREDIDAVVLCGGTNDHKSVEDVEVDGIIKAENPVWISGSKVDAKWAASSFYVGGDFNIGTFVGGVASAIMKMRLWCPNARIILLTPFPRWDTNTMQLYSNDKGLDFREMCEIQVAAAKYMGCPVIDANAECGISCANYSDAVTDGVHPSALGREMYGRAVVDGFSRISPKF